MHTHMGTFTLWFCICGIAPKSARQNAVFFAVNDGSSPCVYCVFYWKGPVVNIKPLWRQQSLFLIFNFTLLHTSSSAMLLRQLGQVRTQSGKLDAASIPTRPTIAGTQLNVNQKWQFCLIQSVTFAWIESCFLPWNKVCRASDKSLFWFNFVTLCRLRLEVPFF